MLTASETSVDKAAVSGKHPGGFVLMAVQRQKNDSRAARKRAWKSAGDAGNISPMEPYLLLVTLVLGQQAPHSYKVEFSSKETCEQAASDLRLNYNKTFRNITGVMTVCAKIMTM